MSGFGPPQHRKDIDLLEGAQQRAPSVVGAGALALRGGAGGAGLVWSGQEMALGTSNAPPVPTTRGQWGARARHLMVVWDGRVRNNGHKSHRFMGSVMRGETFLHEDSQAVEQAAQTGCAICNLGGFQDLTGQGPEQPGLTSDLALLWAGG